MMSASPHLTQPGARLGRYELVSWLGEGGFAEVWLAQDTGTDPPRDVAVKVMRRGRARDAQQKTMFLDEAHLAERIHHPNVAQVLDVGDADGCLFLAMEYVSGGSLDALIEGARLLGETVPAGVALRLISDVCAGLHAAHELAIDGRPQHVVHRDVSPHNILVTEEGVPKLIDFGIAKARERMAKETSTGITKGKIAYMSPEQARGVEIDRRADVWAIAAVAYELLEGRRIIEGPNEIARLQTLVSRPVLLTFEHTPVAVQGVLERALAYYPSDRHATADELCRDFERALAASGLAASRGEVAAFCRRAREAADEEHSSPRLAALLGAPSSEPTVSVIRPATLGRRPTVVRDRMGRFMLVGLGFLLVAGAGALSARRGSPSSAPTHAPQAVVQVQPEIVTPPVPTTSATATPSALASSPSPASPPPIVVRAPVAPPRATVTATAPKPLPTPPKGATPRPTDDDQIE
jgi:eukaryotic-like serine/threonine-protein kinase